MDDLLVEAGSTIDAEEDLEHACCTRAETARDGVVRRSLELRAVVTRLSAAC